MHPLRGIKVLDLTRALAGPYCTQLLAEMGAEVIKVETGAGDDARHLGPPFLHGESALFLCANQNKQGIVVDLDTKEGRKIVHQIVRETDVLVENFRPGVMERYGLGYKQAKKIRPGLIYCSITAWGTEGPYRTKPGVDSILQAMSGLSMISGEEGGPPVRIGTPVIDIATGVYAALAVVGALLTRERTGIGQSVELSLIDVSLLLQLPKLHEYFITGTVPERTGLYSSFGVIGGFFRTRNGHIGLSIINDKYWNLLCESIGMPSLAKDRRFRTNDRRIRNKDALYELLDKVLATKTNRAWKRIFDREGLLSGLVHDYEELFRDRNIRVNRMIARARHSKCGRIPVLRCPIKMEACRAIRKTASPVLGEHTDEVLKGLGYDDASIRALRQKKIVR